MKISENHPAIENVRLQFQNWRSTRNRREPIPNHLWQAAIELCRVHSISHVSQCLKLSYTDLKKRLNLPQPFLSNDCQAPAFRQVDLGSLFQPQNQWQMFCQRPDGSFLTLSGSGENPPVTDILKGFLP
jgi:hypothetical protein